MEMLDFDQVDARLAQVAAVQQMGVMLSKRTGLLIADTKVLQGRWRCFVPGLGWAQASDLLIYGLKAPVIRE